MNDKIYRGKKLKNIILSLCFLFSFTNAEDLIIDSSHSEAGFSIKHLMISNVKGKFNEFDADIDYDIKSKTFSSLESTIIAESIDTGIKKRDDHLRSKDFF